MSVAKRQRITGLAPWHVSAGGVTAPSFVLAMGDLVPRETPLKNPMQPEVFRRNRGSVELLVWSAWRLQKADDVLAASGQFEETFTALKSLRGIKIVEVTCTVPAWDLRLVFADGRELVTFSNHMLPGAAIAENWELWVDDAYLAAGPGATLNEDAPDDRL